MLAVDNKIPAIENLIITKDLYDTIDLTDNEIKLLANFPRLNRLSSLFLSNNSISRIYSEFFSPVQLPRLHTLILTGNRLLDFGDLEPLAAFRYQLKHLSLLDNPVVKKPHYRLFLISRLPALKTLDFKKVKRVEVEEAKKMFGAEAAGDAKVFEVGDASASNEGEPQAKRQKTTDSKQSSLLSAEQIEKIQTAIKNAKTLAEINRLEKILQTGHVPDEKDLKYLQL